VFWPILASFLSAGCISYNNQHAALSENATVEQALVDAVSKELCRDVELTTTTKRTIENWQFLSGEFAYEKSYDTQENCVVKSEFLEDRYMALVLIYSTPMEFEILELSTGDGDAPFVTWQQEYDLPEGLLPGSTNDIYDDKNLEWSK